MMKSSSKLLFFTEFFFPQQNSTAYYLTKIVLTATEKYEGPVHVFCAVGNNKSEELESPNLIVHRLDNGTGNKNALLSRAVKFLRISLKFMWAIIRNARHDDTVFSVTNPAFFIPVCAFLKKIYKYRLILLAYDIFPENLIAAGLAKPDSLLFKIVKKVFDWSYRQADIVISIGRDMTEVLVHKGVAKDKITLIQNWADTDAIKHLPKNDNRIIEQFNLKEKTVFLFAGNFGRVQGIPELIDVIDHVSSDKAAFLFVGDGAMRGEIEKYQKEHPQKAVYWHPHLPMSQQNVFLNACDVAIATLNDKMFGLGVPSKSYYSLASGHPIVFIGDERSEVAQMIQEGHCGWQTSFENIEKCASLFDSICNLPKEEILLKGNQAADYLRLNFSEKTVLNKYSQLFMRLNQ